MRKASSWFSIEDRAAVEAAIAEAESGTSGQIVPVVATSSGRYDRAEDLFGLFFALVALAVAWVLFQGAPTADWSEVVTPALGLSSVIAIVFGGFIVGTVLASHVPLLRLPFVPRSEMQAEVERAASAAFHSHQVRRTAAGTGILIYVSLQERMVRVIGDDLVAEQISAADWDAICQVVVDGMRRGESAAGLVNALQKAGELLGRLLPRDADDHNEIADHLIIVD